MKLRENDGRTVEFKLVDRNTNIDFAEDWLNAGALQRDADGAYLVDDIDYKNKPGKPTTLVVG